MKLKAILLSLLLVSPIAMAWEKLTPSIHAIYGTHIDNFPSTLKTPHVELVYDTNVESFGITLINDNGKRKTIDYAVFNIRTCDINTTGAIAGTNIIDIPSKDQMGRIFLACSRPMIFRVWDLSNGHTTYRFDNVGPLPEN